MKMSHRPARQVLSHPLNAHVDPVGPVPQERLDSFYWKTNILFRIIPDVVAFD